MKACITSIGEPTTELCQWALERNGFEVITFIDQTSLAEKLEFIYDEMNEDFIRVDADIIVNKYLTPQLLQSLDQPDIWWWQFITFDWFKQDINHSMAFIKKEAIPALRNNIKRFQYDIRPETQISRIPEFYNPRRMETYDKQIMGIHGYGIKNMKSVIALKANRGQSQYYDFELAQRLNEL